MRAFTRVDTITFYERLCFRKVYVHTKRGSSLWCGWLANKSAVSRNCVVY